MSENTATPAVPEQPAGKSPKARRAIVLAVCACLVLAAVGAAVVFRHKPPAPAGELAMDKLGLSRPDALIESSSFSQLPKDLLAVPFLHETLTEDFVFYYQSQADRLGVIGSARRIVYEHDLKWQDDLVESLLDQPADVAVWRGADGRLKDFLLVLDRGGLAKLLEPLAKIALDDTQLTKTSDLKVGGDTVPLYRLTFNNKALLFASHGDKLVVLSNPDKLYDHDNSPDVLPGAVSTQALQALLNGDKLFPEAFGLQARPAAITQRISVASSVLAMGYQRFIPNFSGLRFEMDDKGWNSYLAMDELANQPDFDFKPIWKAMPMGASACVALPVAADLQEPLLEKLGAEPAVAKALTEHMSGAAGLCWYADSRLYTPLLVASLSGGSDTFDADLGKLFGSMIGSREKGVAGGVNPVDEQTSDNVHQWQRQVSSSFGNMNVSLARSGATLLFSLDEKLVQKAVGTLDKHFPPLADVLPKDAMTPIYLGPDSLAQLMQQETLDSLPEDMEPVFHNAAQTLLVPKLRKLAGYGKYALTLPEGSSPNGHWQWLPLQWRAL